jgi:hypothetical protein
MSSYKYSSFTANSRNVINNGYNNTLEVSFPGSIAIFNNAEIALKSLTLYNSSFNINAALYGNNTFSIKIPYSGGYSTLNISLPNGYFSYDNINSYIQSQLITAGAYLITTSGQYWYPIVISANSSFYACQIDLALCYTSGVGIPVGWTYPSSGLWTSAGTLAATAYTCQLTFPSGFNNIVGFSVGSYPSTLNYTSTYSITSNITPQINPISSYFLTCSLVNNPMNVVSNVLSSFTTQGTTIGQTINVQSPEFGWLTIPNQNAQTVRFSILDQSYGMVQFQDSQITIELMIRQKNE